ncbi:MAG: glycosyltransferase [Litoreibacter sp.]
MSRSDELTEVPLNAKQDLKVAYMMSRFPKLTETFILNEIIALKARGVTVEIFPLWRVETDKVHPSAEALMDEVHFLPHLNLTMIKDNLYFMLSRPRRYFNALGALISGNRKSFRFLLGALVYFPKLATFARAMEQAGIYHIHAHFANHPAAAAYGLNLLTGIGWSFTAHGSDLHRRQTMLRRKIEKADFVVAISEYNRRFMQPHTDKSELDKIHVVHCGVDTSLFQKREKLPGFNIICVGALYELKGQRHLIEACAKLKWKGWHCHIVGGGVDLSALKALTSKLGLDDQITFHGPCTSERVAQLFSQVQVACSPSAPTADGRREGIPVVLMEAAASSLPLVSSNMSGIPELVRDGVNGFLTEPGDVDGIAHALTTLHDEPEVAARMGAQSRAIVDAEFSLSENTARLNDLFVEAKSC